MKLKYLLAASVVSLSATAAISPTVAVAQQTTSSIQGSVVDESGAPISGASVKITDRRTGRTGDVTTTSTGSFSFRNLEVGGPYTVTVNAGGYQGETVDGLSANLSDTTSLRFELTSDASATPETVIVVTASSVATMPLALGPGSSFNLEVIEEQPTLSRDIRDVIAIDPRVTFDDGFPDDNGAVSCLGTSERNNSLTVDGIRLDDGFGLNSGSPFPSEAQPFPLDSLSAVSVEFAPFDVQYGLFSGCNINVVTKSGGNDFSGGAYYFYRDDSLTGNKVDGDIESLDGFSTEQYGAFIGGPIVPDRLFFFLNYDRVDSNRVIDDGPLGSGAANEAQGVTQAEVDQVRQIVQDVYAFDAGEVLSIQPRSTERIFARIDANITEDHRLAVSYGRTREDFVTIQNLDAFDDEISLSSNSYQSGNNVDAYSLRLFSDWSDNFSTEVRLSRLDNADIQDSLSGTNFQQFEISTPSGGTIFVGPDRFRQRNDLRTSTDQAKLAGFLSAGDHFFTIGFEYDSFDVFNLFIQDGAGTAEFASFADLQNQDPSDFRVRLPISGDPDDATAIFKRKLYSVYLQDEWQATPELSLQAGIRYDFYNGNVRPAANPVFQQRYGFTNQTAFDQLDVLQPRFGFRFDAGETFAGNTTIRGGVGIFSGGDPSVIFSNSYTNNGVTLDDVFLGELQGAGVTGFLGSTIPAGAQGLTVVGDGEVNAIDPDFEIPRTLRANLGIEHQFDFGPSLMLDYIYSKNYDPLFVQDLTLAQTGTAPDGRPLYRQVDFLDPGCATDPGNTAVCSSRTTSDYLLTNGRGGRGHVFSVSVRDQWPQEGSFLGIGGSLTAGYSYQDVTDIQPLTSSRAVSNFGNFSKIDVNNPQAARSNASRTHNAVFRLNLEKDFFENATSQLTFFLRYRTNQPFSFNFETTPFAGFNPFGDSRAFEDRVLLYVPAVNDPTVVYGAGFDLAGFDQYLETTGLDRYRGQIVERNAFDAGDYWDLDLRFQQDVPGFFGKDRFTFSVDLQNALNLIDSSWNTLRDAGFEYNVPIVQTQINDQGQYVFENFLDPTRDGESFPLRTSVGASLWQVQLGARYEF